jgi:serine/threonine-protein kinase HipA
MARIGDTLGIWMNGQHVGTWQRSSRVDRLTYDAEWINSPAGRPLSLSLPITRGHGKTDSIPLRTPAVAAYFQNLIPDNDRILQRLSERHGLDSTSAFDLLSEIGRDCAGAVQLLPPNETPGDVRQILAKPLDEAEVAKLLRQTTSFGPRAGSAESIFRLSIAGAQEKTALLRHGNNWCIPLGATPSTHIFKLPLGLVGNAGVDLRDSVELEWLCMEFMREFDMDVAKTQIAQFEDQKVLIVERFDRELAADGTWWMRIPQEDFCQASGLPPSAKYEVDGGPGAPQIMEVLRGSENATADRIAFFKTLILFWLLAATDGHAKNFSLRLMPGGRYRLTPLYDVLSTYPIQGRGPSQQDPREARLAMAVVAKNRHYLIHEVHRWHWTSMAERLGLTEDVGGLISDIVEQAPRVLDRLANRLPTRFPQPIYDAVDAGVRRAAKRLATEPDRR